MAVLPTLVAVNFFVKEQIPVCNIKGFYFFSLTTDFTGKDANQACSIGILLAKMSDISGEGGCVIE